MPSHITINTLYSMKQKGEKITSITAYDYPFAKISDEAGIHIILVGDSVGMVVAGEDNTLGVTMDQMIYHTKIVSKAVNHAMVIADMPFMSYQTSVEQAITNAGRFLKESNASAVKLEGGATVSKTIKAITECGIPVQAHIGLLPQSIHQMGGYRVQRDEAQLLSDARTVEEAGAFSVVIEGIPADIAAEITQTISIPTIGIGAGPDCDGQILVIHDLLGMTDRRIPKFVKQYTSLRQQASDGIKEYIADVQNKTFPLKDHSY
ncbi:MAG: 3-methyl-2-oxobutanoate hydroxymethyltransferase [Desulfobacteraceae bacterium]|nr:3-methyl-2-oxobutanoate hydroxymethyltransferase [Desulfobacteraceae bacterium]MBC2757184.1 3-methyl-2-oxobutanoate hydroxymethyltransferase [Desulfobacteraceae bacterium]